MFYVRLRKNRKFYFIIWSTSLPQYLTDSSKTASLAIPTSNPPVLANWLRLVNVLIDFYFVSSFILFHNFLDFSRQFPFSKLNTADKCCMWSFFFFHFSLSDFSSLSRFIMFTPTLVFHIFNTPSSRFSLSVFFSLYCSRFFFLFSLSSDVFLFVVFSFIGPVVLFYLSGWHACLSFTVYTSFVSLILALQSLHICCKTVF